MVLINFVYLLVDGMAVCDCPKVCGKALLTPFLQSLYLSSYALIVTDWSYQDWTYYNNTVSPVYLAEVSSC